MYSPNFDYYRARSVAEAQQLLAAHPGAKLRLNDVFTGDACPDIYSSADVCAHAIP